MRKMLTLGLAIASLSASVAGAGAAAALEPEVRPDTLTHVQGSPPWPACTRWDSRTVVCRDAAWRGRRWRSWYGRHSCRRGHGWWLDSRGRWRRC